MFSQLCSLVFKMNNTDSEVLLQNCELAWFWNETEEYVIRLFGQLADHIVSSKGLLEQDVA
jgi:hypothetical protein